MLTLISNVKIRKAFRSKSDFFDTKRETPIDTHIFKALTPVFKANCQQQIMFTIHLKATKNKQIKT